jgi:hypothetical protein
MSPENQGSCTQMFSATARAPDTPTRWHITRLLDTQFPNTDGDGRARYPGGLRHSGDAAPAQFHRLGGAPVPTQAFIHCRRQRFKLPSNPFDSGCIVHAAAIAERRQKSKINLTILLLHNPLLDLEQAYFPRFLPKKN